MEEEGVVEGAWWRAGSEGESTLGFGFVGKRLPKVVEESSLALGGWEFMESLVAALESREGDCVVEDAAEEAWNDPGNEASNGLEGASSGL